MFCNMHKPYSDRIDINMGFCVQFPNYFHSDLGKLPNNMGFFLIGEHQIYTMSNNKITHEHRNCTKIASI